MSKKKAEQLIQERVQRVRDAIALKEPDRVPITPWTDIFFPALQVGMTHKQAMYKGKKYCKAATEVYSRYDWDIYPPLLVPGIGKLFDGIGHSTIKWAGAANPELRLGDNQPYQYIQKAYAILAYDWDVAAKEWQKNGHDLPPVLLTVCNRTETAARIEQFFNSGDCLIKSTQAPNKTLRVDSKVLEKAERGESVAKNKEYDQRLTEIIETAGS